MQGVGIRFKGYRRLDTEGEPGGGSGWRRPRTRQRPARVEPAGERRRRRRFWRMRTAPKLGFLRRAAASPRRLLAGIRDAYVRMMLRFADSRVFRAGAGRGPPAQKEYEEKVIVEIYTSLMAQRHLFAAAGAAPRSGQTLPRR